MQAVAIKKSSRETTIGFQEMGTLRCDGCGEEFFIGHNPTSVDKWVAEKQANLGRSCGNHAIALTTQSVMAILR